MATIEFILLLGVAVIISAILDQIVPKISTPLIQIGLGVVMALLSVSPINVHIDPELFLVLFIAPLLFRDSVEANKKNLWENKVPILWYAIGLVLLITLVVGFVLNWLVPSIPLAAAFALGAALGPTDAVAVSSLKKEASIGKRENSILQGEALINDASGVVSFQFAIAAAVTSAFSLADAASSFVVSFVGGIAFGIVLALICLFISTRIKALGLDNITFHVLFEVLMPFLVFLAAEIIHVSGILAVVACGIVWSMFRDRKISPYQSRLNIALSSVWGVLCFALNGIVFVLLGLQLPLAMQTSWDDVQIHNLVLCGYVLIITVLIVGLRFVWALVVARTTKNPATGKRDRITKRLVKGALVTTVGGAKGAITLSIIFSIPFFLSDGSHFPQRDLIIFLASGVILCTLLLANFLLPVLAPKKQTEDEEELEELTITKIEILRTVLEHLMADINDSNEHETKIVVKSYNNRIRTIRDSVDLEPPSTTQLRIKVINVQADSLFDAIEANEVDRVSAFNYIRRLMSQKELLSHERVSLFSLRRYLGRWNVLFKWLSFTIKNYFSEGETTVDEGMHLVRIKAEEAALEYLRKLIDNPDYPSEVVARFIISHERTLSILNPEDPSPVTSTIESATAQTEDIQRKAFRLEREVIQDFYSAGKLTRLQAKDMMDNVSLMMIDLEESV